MTLDELRSLLVYESETGLFRWTANHNSTKPLEGTVAGTVVDGYIQIKIGGRAYKAHRLAWFYVHGVWPDNQVDHRDQVRSNNRLSNLRSATRAQNAQNVSRRGIHQEPSGRWRARIQVDGKSTVIGHYDSPEAAHAAYIEAKGLVHPFWGGGKS